MSRISAHLKADLEVKKELSPTNLVVEVPATTSSTKVKLSELTKVTKQSAADGIGITVLTEMENLEEVNTEVATSPQSSSIQCGSAGDAKQTEGSLLAQMRELLTTNKESMDHIAKLNTAQMEKSKKKKGQTKNLKRSN